MERIGEMFSLDTYSTCSTSTMKGKPMRFPNSCTAKLVVPFTIRLLYMCRDDQPPGITDSRAVVTDSKTVVTDSKKMVRGSHANKQ